MATSMIEPNKSQNEKLHNLGTWLKISMFYSLLPIGFSVLSALCVLISPESFLRRSSGFYFFSFVYNSDLYLIYFLISLGFPLILVFNLFRKGSSSDPGLSLVQVLINPKALSKLVLIEIIGMVSFGITYFAFGLFWLFFKTDSLAIAVFNLQIYMPLVFYRIRIIILIWTGIFTIFLIFWITLLLLRRKKTIQSRRMSSTVPIPTLRWLKYAGIAVEEYLERIPAIEESIKLLFHYLDENNSFPSKRELFNFGAPLKAIKSALQLLNTPYVIHEEDIKEIDWLEFDRKSRKIIRQLGSSFETYTLDNLVLQGNTDLVTAKQFLALLAFLPWLKESLWAVQVSESTLNLDKVACLILRFQHRYNIKKANLLQLAFEQRQGLVTVLKSIAYAEQLIKRTDLLEQVPPITLRTIEEKARVLSKAESTGELLSVTDPGEVAEVLNLESLILTLQTITFFLERVLELAKEERMLYIDSIEVSLEEKITFTADRNLEQEAEKLLNYLKK